MKVSTVSCIFGAWVSQHIPHKMNVLDIGAGTGLLSLIYAQENPLAIIDAIELEKEASMQCIENFKNSKWCERLQCINMALESFKSNKKYDLIICNPPFFVYQNTTESSKRNIARGHSNIFSFFDYFPYFTSPYTIISLLLSPVNFEKICMYWKNLRWNITNLIKIANTEKALPFAYIVVLEKNQKCKINIEDLIIYVNKGKYTTNIQRLLSQFYL